MSELRQLPRGIEIVEAGYGKGWPRVSGVCPSCGLKSLFLASGGYITCGGAHCPEPTALADSIEWKMAFERMLGDDGAGSSPPSPTDRPATRYRRWVTPWKEEPRS